MLKSGGCKKGINNGPRFALDLKLSGQVAPALGNPQTDGQNAITQPRHDLGIEPLLQKGAAIAGRHQSNSLADFADGKNAYEDTILRAA